ncbi:sirohydrochlorin chelatase [Streptomyces sp. NPDC013457]|uniref:sirohydrochlorin chelatase n=1 Tax=Streptomyces sp. NPDC013457 TaxID=3364866 RepID=UPI0036F4BC7E
MTERDSTFDSTAELLGTITTRLAERLSRVRPYDVRRRPALVAVGHGSRDPRAAVTLSHLVDRIRELRPGLDVRLAHIELNAPLLPDVLADVTAGIGSGVLADVTADMRSGVTARSTPGGTARVTPGGTARSTPGVTARVTPGVTPDVTEEATARVPAGLPGREAAGPGAVLVPLLFGPGHHVKHDLPAAAAALPEGQVRIAAPLGAHPLLVEALADRLAEAGWTSADSASRATGVVLAAAGSRDPEGLAAVRRIAAALSERLGGVPVLPAYTSAATPTVPDAVRVLAARGRHRVAVASCFTAPGLFAGRAAAHAPWIAAPPLGDHPALARLILHRYDRSLAAPAATWRQLASA